MILIQIADKDLVALEVKYHKHVTKSTQPCKARFPQLLFHIPKVRNKSETVYAECLGQASVAEGFMDDDIQTSQSSHARV